MSKQQQFEGYKWIKVKKYKMDESKSWEERYRELEQHHIEETTFLIQQVRELAKEIDDSIQVLDEKFKAEYWELVRRCLIEIANFTPDAAVKECLRLKSSSSLFDDELFYHNEPLSVALDLAGISAQDTTQEMLDKYQEIAEQWHKGVYNGFV